MKKFFSGKRFFFILLAVVFLWGVALRSTEVISGNYLFGFDVGRDLLVARDIVVNHKLTLIGAEIGSGSAGINGIFQGPGFYYLLAIVYWLGHGNPYGALLMMFVFGVATLIAVYFTVSHMFGRWTALISLFLVGISPLIVSQSRFIWPPHPASLLIALLLYFAYMIPKRPRLYAPLSIFFAALTYHFELAMTVPIVIAFFIALPSIYHIKDVKTYVLAFASLIFGFLPMILFEMRHGWMATRSIFSYTAPQGMAGPDVWLFRINDHIWPYIYNAANSFIQEHGLLPAPFFIYLCGGLLITLVIFSWKTKDAARRKFFQFSLLSLATSYAVLLGLNNSVWDYYLIHAHFIFIYVLAYLMWFSWQGMRKSVWLKVIFGILSVFLISMIASSVWRTWISYTYDYHDLGGVEKIQGKKIAVDYVYKDAKGQPFSEFTFMAPIYTYPYDYLFQTYGPEKYGYAPGSQKKGLVYLIIEPDSSKPWTYKGWLETVIVGGRIVKTVNLPTGHIIQERLFP